MHAAGQHRLDRRPYRIAAHARGEGAVDRDDDGWTPEQHLLDRDDGKAALALARDIDRTEECDRLNIDRSAKAGLEAARAAGVIDARTAVVRDFVDPTLDHRDRGFGCAGQL